MGFVPGLQHRGGGDGSMSWSQNGATCRKDVTKPALITCTGIWTWFTTLGHINYSQRVTNFEETSMRYVFMLQIAAN